MARPFYVADYVFSVLRGQSGQFAATRLVHRYFAGRRVLVSGYVIAGDGYAAFCDFEFGLGAVCVVIVGSDYVCGVVVRVFVILLFTQKECQNLSILFAEFWRSMS